ncbi:MAG: hypothetical protein IT349_05075 [Candidatus Eisenbacteria bacterium]|nr:hypothetical protein [Candidatus Eisenbacteria bacterium]MCC7141456.1 hypothetical protein [Candidatus Eisenbacteria bacterium]
MDRQTVFGRRGLCLALAWILTLSILAFAPADLAHHLHGCDDDQGHDQSTHSCLLCQVTHHAEGALHDDPIQFAPPRATETAAESGAIAAPMQCQDRAREARAPPPVCEST